MAAFQCDDGFYYGVVYNTGTAYFMKFKNENAARIVTEKMAKVTRMASCVLNKCEYYLLSSLMPHTYADSIVEQKPILTDIKAEAKAFGNAMALCWQIREEYATVWPILLDTEAHKAESGYLTQFMNRLG